MCIHVLYTRIRVLKSESEYACVPVYTYAVHVFTCCILNMHVMMMIAFITFKSSLVPLFEGL